MHVIRPDSEDQTVPKAAIRVFLAGTIDNGKAALWSHRVIKAVSDIEDVVLFDPRRETWWPDIEARAHDETFRQQVEWELAHIEACDIPFFNFEADSVSPITLQELGYVIGVRATESVPREWPIVVCPDGFWRKGNVEMLSNRFEIDVLNTLDEGIAELRNALAREGAYVAG